MWIFAGFGLIGSVIAFVLSFVPPSQISVGSPADYVWMLIGGTVIAVLIPFIVYAVQAAVLENEGLRFRTVHLGAAEVALPGHRAPFDIVERRSRIRRVPMTLSPSAIGEAVKAGLQAALEVKGGANASYIPYLAGVPSTLCGVCAVTPDGQVFEAGDTRYGFAIESISKGLHARASRSNSRDARRCGRRSARARPDCRSIPSWRWSFMATSRCRRSSTPARSRPRASSRPPAARTAGIKILGCYRSFANAELPLSKEVNDSEQATNLHNRAIAWLLASAGYCYCDPLEALDVYTRQCSVLVTCAELAAMAGTLANRGVNPLSKKAVVRAENVPAILAEMTMEGLYDASGDWAFEVGLPGKSGVGGGIMAVAPGRLAIAAFSPPLDEWGNSVRAQKAVATVAQKLGLNLYAS